VENLSVTYHSHRGPVEAVKDVSFTVGREKVGIVGESGSGKSTLGRALLRVLPTSATVAGRILLEGNDLVTIEEKKLLEIRGGTISMILQDPKYSLNPVMKVGEQIAEAFILHHKTDRKVAKQKVVEMLDAVQIRDPERVYQLYPHEVSGGMGQRIVIAMMLVANPNLIIADEITSSLDVTVSMQVLAILDDLVRDKGLGLIFVSHDLGLVASFCDRVLIMYDGRIVEECEGRTLRSATHPYTRGLIEAIPDIDRPRARLAVLERCPSWLDDKESSECIIR
jgi:peptide/nickel transport system ATP-binding protein